MAAAARRGRNPERRMTLGEHLVELRRRVVISAAGILLGAVGGWFLFDPAWHLIAGPVQTLEAAHPGEVSINFQNVSTAFDVRFSISVMIGVVISSPIWLFQIFAFFAPGLTKRERGWVFGFFFSAVPLFLVGCAAGFTVMPHVVTIMASFVPGGGTSLFAAKDYLDFVLKLVLVTGVAFSLPAFVVLFNFIGVVSGRSILHAWRWAILGITLFTAIATPSADVLSMILLAIPMVVLYFAAVVVSLLHDRRLAKRRERLLADSGHEAVA